MPGIEFAYKLIMYKGIYIALSGAILKQKHMDVHAQNVANANTSGYKKDRLSFKDYLIPVDNSNPLVSDGRSMTELSNSTTDFSSGVLNKTGNPLDIAINGGGFFALEGNRYTRNGSFKIDGEGYLVTLNDIKVLGSGGPISLNGSNVAVTSSGEIIVDNSPVDILQIVDFPDKSVLSKMDGSVFTAVEQGETVNSDISQGYLETSNVDAVREMVEMLTSQREFEAYQKIIRLFDDASSRTINEMGK